MVATRPEHGSRRAVTALPPLVLVVLLHLVQPRRAHGEDELDLKVMYYQESDDRIRVVSPTFSWTRELNELTTLKVEGIYNAISGASPTGAPPVPRSTVLSVPARGLDFTYLSGATGYSSPSSSSSSSGGGGGGGGSRTTTRSLGALSTATELVSPVAEVDDTRIGVNAELARRMGHHQFAGQVAFSTEDDYVSLAGTVRDAVELNEKLTSVTVGLSVAHDEIDPVTGQLSETKDTVDAMVGVAQILGPRTLAVVNLSLGASSGYLSDPYKVVDLNGVLVAEERPDSRDRQILFTSLTQYFDGVRGSLEGSYRFFTDSFGIDAHTVGLAYHQRIGEHLIVRPALRLYRQSAADFYAVRFTGAPAAYSSDHRVSDLESTSYGLKLIWEMDGGILIDAAFERYVQDGTDGVTNPDVYSTADVLTFGVGLPL